MPPADLVETQSFAPCRAEVLASRAGGRMRSELQRQRCLWRRRPQFECGCFEPCRCDYRNHPSQKRTDAYLAAVEHLAAEGLLAGALTPELRQLWQRGGSDRQVADTIVRRWAA